MNTKARQDLPFELIEAFLKAAESRTFLEASQQLGISQALLSSKLKAFEKSLPSSVFVYRGRKKILSLYGQELYQSLSAHFSAAQKSLAQINLKYQKEESIELRIGGRSEICAKFIKDLGFGGLFKIISCPAPEAYRLLLKQELDVALGYEKIDSSEVVAKKIFSSKCCLMYSAKTYPLLKRDPLSVENLKRLPFLSYRVGGPIFKNLQAYLGRDFPLRPRVECDDWLGLLKLIESGLGYSVIPDYIPAGNGVVSHLLPEKFFPAMQFYAFYPKHLLKVAAFSAAIRRLKCES